MVNQGHKQLVMGAVVGGKAPPTLELQSAAAENRAAGKTRVLSHGAGSQVL